MCNLNIVIKSQDYPKDHNALYRLLGFLMSTTANSYTSNKDGDGVFFSGGVKSNGLLIRQVNKVNLAKYRPYIALSNHILTHQRISTSGREPKFNQPFMEQEFILIHNGIMSSFEEEGKSDTYVFFHRFVKEFNKLKKVKARSKRVLKALNNTFKDANNYDNFSIALYDKKEDATYYFKNKGRNISWYNDDKILYLTTSNQNEIFLPMLKRDLPEREVENNTLYKIESLKTKVKFSIVGKLIIPEKVSKTTYIPAVNYSKPKNMGAEGLEKFFDTTKKKPYDLVIQDFSGYCDFCKVITHQYDTNRGFWICSECIKEGIAEEYLATLGTEVSSDNDWYGDVPKFEKYHEEEE